jgi:protein Tex
VDPVRKRISLTMKLGATAPRPNAPRENRYEGAGRGQRAPAPAPASTAMAGAFAKLQGLRK